MGLRSNSDSNECPRPHLSKGAVGKAGVEWLCGLEPQTLLRVVENEVKGRWQPDGKLCSVTKWPAGPLWNIFGRRRCWHRTCSRFKQASGSSKPRSKYVMLGVIQYVSNPKVITEPKKMKSTTNVS